jgi:hypothetical protein
LRDASFDTRGAARFARGDQVAGIVDTVGHGEYIDTLPWSALRLGIEVELIGIGIDEIIKA